REGPSARPRPPGDHPPPARLQPRAPDIPVPGARLSTDRRVREGDQADPGMSEGPMFTGLVEVLGQVEALVEEDAGKRLTVRWPGLESPLAIGDSVAVNGCCLTVVRSEAERFEVQAGPETLLRTNLGTRRPGDAINLERSLRVGDRLGGHFVQGHVDATAVLA